MTRYDRWQLMTIALELRLAARAQSMSLLPIVPVARMVEIAEAMETLSGRVAVVSDRDARPPGFCAWD